MSYTSNVPTSGQLISQSQPIINANFVALASFGNGYAELSNQSMAPSFSAGNDGLYVLNNATTTKNEMYIHIQNQAGTVDIPFTASAMSNVATASCVNGWSYLPSGLLVKWGSFQATAATVLTVNVGSISGGPVYNQVFQTYLTPFWNGGVVTSTPSQPILVAQGTTTAGNFTCFFTNYNATYSYLTYMVIGV